MDLIPIDGVGLADAAVLQIREGILEGRLEGGVRIGEVELSRALQVSRAPIREALLRLEQEGLVHSSRHKGKTVVELSGRDIDELVSLRIALERLAWTQACVEHDEQDLSGLRQCTTAMRDAVDRQAFAELVRLDIDFHDRVFLAAKHERLYSVWSAIKWQVALYLLNRRTVFHDYHKIIVAEHEQLTLDLSRGDEEMALAAITEHIKAAHDRLKSSNYGDRPYDLDREPQSGKPVKPLMLQKLQ